MNLVSSLSVSGCPVHWLRLRSLENVVSVEANHINWAAMRGGEISRNLCNFVTVTYKNCNVACFLVSDFMPVVKWRSKINSREKSSTETFGVLNRVFRSVDLKHVLILSLSFQFEQHYLNWDLTVISDGTSYAISNIKHTHTHTNTIYIYIYIYIYINMCVCVCVCVCVILCVSI